ncbi:TetR family transcriptional regulator [Tamaricihabitans halophyticus]|uniref:TetR family transcriptional regulator n=1 Tax=Tamaricihabitans halophyticus TaxID=1262583 RepID=A0A4R2QEA6_9PSEU|nr:TetR/AcrR family transcriptional regulator [Tamaricihabitans halophyticus]TCP46794.1 TetR family transcriptional regulator [Tamaricihabitans halophyticus]
MTTSAPRKKRMPRAEREQQMLTIAEEVFVEQGFVASSMDDIAARVGVSKPMIYEYFGSKEGLLVACIRRAKAELFDCVANAAAGITDPEMALRSGFTAFFRYADEHRLSWQLVLNNEGALAGSAAAEAIEEIRTEQTTLDRALLETFVPHVPGQTLDAIAEIIVGACERLSRWYVRTEGVTAEDAAEYVMRLAWYGLRPLVASSDENVEPVQGSHPAQENNGA